MTIIRLHRQATWVNLPASVVTIGNFDGVHVGHQAMLAEVNRIAQATGLARTVMIFEPQPLEYFAPEQAPARIYNLREKIQTLKQYGVDQIVIAQFDHHFRNLTADEFAKMLQGLNSKILVLGDDFHFAKNREGDSTFLKRAGFDVYNLNTVDLYGERISSTRIRQTLQQGDFKLASELLGRPYDIVGRVLHGDKIGRTLDFPTINVGLKRLKPCLHGIYAVEVECLDDTIFNDLLKQNQGIAGYHAGCLFGAGHVGVRPAIAQKQAEWRLEVHFPALKADLYGRMMRVRFLHYLHGEKNYPSLEALKQGIQNDVAELIQYRQSYDYPFLI